MSDELKNPFEVMSAKDAELARIIVELLIGNKKISVPVMLRAPATIVTENEIIAMVAGDTIQLQRQFSLEELNVTQKNPVIEPYKGKKGKSRRDAAKALVDEVLRLDNSLDEARYDATADVEHQQVITEEKWKGLVKLAMKASIS